jgi:CubicO group peptidase (beta-lactamase class C family)
MMKKSTLLLLIGVFLTSCQQRDGSERDLTNDNKIVSDSLTKELVEIYKQGYINGFSVAIVNQSGTLYQKGIGYADVETQRSYTENTVQNIASISKTLIGISLLKAQEMGKLNLDDPINKYLPFPVRNPYHPNKPITIRHLATHTSSIVDTDYYLDKSYVLKDGKDSAEINPSEISQNFNLPETRITMGEFLKNILTENGEWYKKEGFLDKKPGELFEYTNVGATLAAFIIEIVTGKPYDIFTQNQILKPLGMSSSGWNFQTTDYSNFSTLYANPKTPIPHYSLITYPDGGFITSINDMGKYLTELIKGYSGNGVLLSKESYSELYREQLDSNNFKERNKENPYNDEYNFGIFIGFSAKGYVGHTGGDPGVGSYMFFDSNNKIGRVLIINTSLNDKEGEQEFFLIWDKLEEYQEKLK